jgi:small subunit ribosomal protein S2
MMPTVTLEDLLEAGAHFGHQTHRWHPKMKKYIFGERAGIHLIDLKQTLYSLLKAYEVIRKTVADGGTVLFIGTKKQAKAIIREEAERAEMFYVAERWPGGMLTNFRTIRESVDKMREIERAREDGTFEKITKKEILEMEKDYERLQKVLSGIKDMNRLPSVLFIIDAKKEIIAVREARKLNIPIVGMCDTNTDPDIVDYVIPANDDALKSIKLISHTIADAVIDGRSGGQLLRRIEKESKAAREEAEVVEGDVNDNIEE